MKIVIFAGGSGTRLWPLSRTATPKQFSPVITDQTMLIETVNRFRDHYDIVDDLFISTGVAFVDEIKRELPDLPEEHIIVEPSKRDTGPAMGYVAAHLSRICPDEPVAFLPSDHLIHDVDLFLQCLEVADKQIRDTSKMIVVGIPPLYRATTLGYTGVGETITTANGIELLAFHGQKEKPDYDTADHLIREGYLWNSGYFMWTPQLFLDAYKTHAPEIYASLMDLRTQMDNGATVDAMATTYNAMEKISIDYAVIEKMDHDGVAVIKGTFGWSDVGAWDAVYKEKQKGADADGNVTRGNVTTVDSTGNLVYGQKNKKIALLDCEDLVIVDTKDALLVMPRAKAADLKKVVEELENNEDDKEFL